jgi:hypothetical protein
MQRERSFEVSLTSLLPLLRESAQSVATVKHVMAKIKDKVAFLNPGQVPVVAADQPIFALAEQIQWEWPTQFGEDKMVIMFGGLHIEMAVLKSIGTLLKTSGWTSALVEAQFCNDLFVLKYTSIQKCLIQMTRSGSVILDKL